jgi:hypothetical protein
MAFGENNEDLAFCTQLLLKVLELPIAQGTKERDSVQHSILKSFLKSNAIQMELLHILAAKAVCHFFLQSLDHRTPACIKREGSESSSTPDEEISVRDFSLHSDSREENVAAAATTLPPFDLIRYAAWEGDAHSGDIPQQCVRIPVIPGVTQSILLTCQWRDQGHGNSKGQLFVIAKNNVISPTESGKAGPDAAASVAKGTVIWESPIVSHETTALEMSFVPRADAEYYVYQKVGGGMNYLLDVENLKIHVTVHDRTFVCQACQTLQKCGALNNRDADPSFRLQLLLAVVRHLYQCTTNQGTGLKPCLLVTHFESHGFLVHKHALSKLQEMLECLVEFHSSSKTAQSVTTTNSQNDTDFRFRTYAAM